MTQTDLYTALKSLGMPVAYGEFTQPTVPPFITYQFAYSSDLVADNQNYVEVSNLQVELYTTTKDLVHEGLIQDLLKSLYLPYRKIETRLDSEKMYQIIYEIQLIGG